MPPIMASDRDTTPLQYALIGGAFDAFQIDTQTGTVTTLELLDYEETREYSNLTLIVYDRDFLNSTASLRVLVQDENDNSPTFVAQTVQLSIPESTAVGSEIFVALATDLDDTSNAQVTYSLNDMSEDFAINPLSGAITVNAVVDFEMQQEYMLEVTATDGGSPARSSVLPVNVDILDENDNAPVIVNPMPTYSIGENLEPGQLVGSIDALDADNGTNAEIFFEIIAGNELDRFFIIPANGDIFTNATIDREERSVYVFTVEVSMALYTRNTKCI